MKTKNQNLVKNNSNQSNILNGKLKKKKSEEKMFSLIGLNLRIK